MNGGEGPKKGALHKELGVPMGKKIPKDKIEKASKKGGVLGKRAKLAETLEGLHKKAHGHMDHKKFHKHKHKAMEHESTEGKKKK
jgi:hypothetical protein